METRVERYKKLSEEIEMMDQDETSSKSKSSRVVNDILKENKSSNNKSLSLDNTLKPYEFYESGEEVKKEKPRLSPLEKRRIAYIIIGSCLIFAILVALIVVGIILIH